jgi:uncharacterized protein with GYD domain
VTDVSVVKVWVDDGDRDGVRPDAVTVVLLADGVKVAVATLDADNDWSATFAGLPVYDAGNVIVYSIEEIGVDAYAVAVNNGSAYDFTVVNTHVPAVTEVSVVKVWNDSDNQDGVRPGNVTVVLLADGVEVAVATLDADNDWSATFAGLPVYDAGEVIVYSIEEFSVDNYTSEIVDSGAYSFTVTNTHVLTIIPIEAGTNSTPNYGSELNETTEVIGKTNETEEPPVMIYEIPEITPDEPIKFVNNKTPSNEETPVIGTPDNPEPVINQTNDDDNLTVPEVEVPEDVPVSNITNETNPVPVDHDRKPNPPNTTEDTPVPGNNPPIKEQTHKKSNVEVNDKQTGNPILVLLLTLLSIIALEIKRERK